MNLNLKTIYDLKILLFNIQADWVLTFQDEYENHNFDIDHVAEWRFWCIMVITFITCGNF